jgi:hypothetical protein
VRAEIERHEHASEAYEATGLQILELPQTAYSSCLEENPQEQARLVKSVVSNSTFVAEVSVPPTLSVRRVCEWGRTRKLAPQVGFEPTTLRLTGGKNLVSRALLTLVLRCRNLRPHLGYRAILDFRLVPLFAAVCRPLLPPKGKKRATSQRRSPGRRRRSSFGEGQVRL